MKILLLLTSLSLVFIEHCTNQTNVQNIDNQTIESETVIEKSLTRADAQAKVARVNINEPLWLKKKYNINRLYPHCLMTDKESLAIQAQNQEILLKHGNFFWQKIKSEVDSIEKNHLGYKKANINALETYLSKNNFTTKFAENSKSIQNYVGHVNFTIQPYGQLSNIEVDMYEPLKPNFTRKQGDKMIKKLRQLMNDAPFCRPSSFLNQPIIDSTRVCIRQMN